MEDKRMNEIEEIEATIGCLSGEEILLLDWMLED